MTLSLTPSSPSDLGVSASRRSIASPTQSSVLSPQSSSSAPGPWLSLQEAAKRSGKNAGHLGRLCRDKWLGEGLAREIVGGGKKKRYEVREDADPAFARVKFAEAIGTDLRAFSQGKRDEALRRKGIIDRWEAAKAARFQLGLSELQVTNQFLVTLEAKGVRVSRRTLYNWYNAWRRGGLAGLVDERGVAEPGAVKEEDPFLEEVKRLYLLSRKLPLTVCHELACHKAAEKGWTERTYKTSQRFIKKVPAAVVSKHRLGVEAWTNDHAPYIERDYSGMESNEEWCSDHHQFDVIVNSRGKLVRPWMTAWQDMRSRKIVGLHVFDHDPNQDTVFISLHGAMSEFGVPRGAYLDNGKDYDSFALNGRTKKDRWMKQKTVVHYDGDHVAGLFGSLGIEAVHCQPYHGQSKPIERFFGTVVRRFARLWPTWVGSSPDDKPEDLQLALERGKAPAFEDFAAAFAQWVRDDYNAKPGHQGDAMQGQSPDAVYAACLDTVRPAKPELLALLALKQHKPIKVGQNGVRHDGLNYGQYEPALIPMQGKDVILRTDPKDASTVQVWTTDGKFICLAPSNAQIPANADSQAVRAANAEKKRHAKLLKEFHEVRPRIHEDLPDLMLRAAAARRAQEAAAGGATPPPQGPTLRPIRSTLEDELPAVQRAIEQQQTRRATGTDDAAAGGGFVYRGTFSPEDEG